MKKFFVIVGVAIFSINLTGCASAPVEKTAQRVVTAKAIVAELPQELGLTGTLEPTLQTDLAAKTAGRIVELSVETGNRFQKNDVLVRLDAQTESAVVSGINQNLKSAEKNLKTLRALYAERLKSAEQNLDLVQKTGAKQIELIQTQIKEARQRDLANTKALGESSVNLIETQLETAQRDLELNAQTVLTNATIALQNTVDTLDHLLAVSDKNRDVNIVFESYLGVFDSNSKTAAELATTQLWSQNEDFYKYFQEEILDVTHPSAEVIDQNLTKTLEMLNLAKVALEKNYTMLLNSTTGANFSENDLNTYKQKISQLGQNIQNLILALQNIRGEAGVASQILVLEEQLQQTATQASVGESAVEGQIAILESQLAQAQVSVEAQITQAKLQIDTLKKEESAKVAEAQSMVTQIWAEQGVNLTSLDNTIIKAPFDGIVLEKYAEVGSVVLPSTPLLKLADDSKMKVVVAVPDTVIQVLALNQMVQIRIDALTDEIFTGKIIKIAPNADPVTKKITVEVELENTEEKIKPGMFARLDFNLGKIEGVRIPTEALVSRYGQNFVFVVEDSFAVKKTVQIETQNNEAAIVSTGLKGGEQVIIKGQLYLQDGDYVEIVH